MTRKIKLSDKRLEELRRFSDLGHGLDGDDTADLLGHIDALQAESAQPAPCDTCGLDQWTVIRRCVACGEDKK